MPYNIRKYVFYFTWFMIISIICLCVLYSIVIIPYKIEAETQKEYDLAKSAGNCRIVNVKYGYDNRVPIIVYKLYKGEKVGYHVIAYNETIIDKSRIINDFSNANGLTKEQFISKYDKVVQLLTYNFRDNTFDIEFPGYYDYQTWLFLINIYSHIQVYEEYEKSKQLE